MSKSERVLTGAAAAEAALLGYAALAAFLTPTGSSEHHLIPMLGFSALALPLVWHVAHRVMRSPTPADPLVLPVLLPNVTLLISCLAGAFPGDGSTGSLSVAIIACAALAMTAGALLAGRAQLDAHPPSPLPRTQQ